VSVEQKGSYLVGWS